MTDVKHLELTTMNKLRKIFPNPMSSIKADKVAPASISTLGSVTRNTFFAQQSLTKRQMSSSMLPLSNAEVAQICPIVSPKR